MSVKPQTLHHKRTVSSLNRPSPGTPASATQPSPAASSPERAQKRARFDGLPPPPTAVSPAESKVAPSPAAGGSEKDKKGSAGVQWILGQIKIMEQQYKDAVVAAVLIMQNKAYSRKFRMKSKTIPIHLSQRLEYAWAAYEATRRHIEFYLIQCAEYNATAASKPAPVNLPPPVAIPSRLTPQTVASSPVPLSTAGLMGLSPSDATRLANLASRPSGLPTLPDGALVFNTGTDGGLDLGSMNMEELDAFINSSTFDFSTVAPPAGTGATPAGDITAMTPNTQAETDRLLASLSNLDGPTPVSGIGVGAGGTSATPGGDDVDSLLARLAKSSEDTNGEANFQFDFNTDLGDLDLGSLTELTGLFDSANPSQGGTGAATPAAPAAATKNQSTGEAPANPSQAAPTETAPPVIAAPAEPQLQPPQQQQQQQPQQPSTMTGFEGLLGNDGINGGGEIDLNLDGLVDQSGEYDLEGGINMDDFDFGDGQIPSVDGEDFDAMFKDFQ